MVHDDRVLKASVELGLKRWVDDRIILRENDWRFFVEIVNQVTPQNIFISILCHRTKTSDAILKNILGVHTLRFSLFVPVRFTPAIFLITNIRISSEFCVVAWSYFTGGHFWCPSSVAISDSIFIQDRFWTVIHIALNISCPIVYCTADRTSAIPKLYSAVGSRVAGIH